MYWVTKKKSKRPLFIVFSFLLVVFSGWLGYYLYPSVSYYFVSNTYLQLENNALRIEKRLLSQNESISSLLSSIEQAKKLTEITLKKKSDEALVHYYLGLFYYYELFVRVVQDQKSLIELSGRGLLPVHTKFGKTEIEIKPISPLSHKIMVTMNQALALEPNFIRNKQAKLLLAYSSLLFTGRTDKKMLAYINELKNIEFTPLLTLTYEWVSISYYSLLGQKKELLELLLPLKDHQIEKDKKETNHLYLQTNAIELLLAEGLFHSKDYMASLKYIRNILSAKEMPNYILVETLRIEAEIALIQRGASIAHSLFEKAYEASEKKDMYIADRIKEIYSTPTKKK